MVLEQKDRAKARSVNLFNPNGNNLSTVLREYRPWKRLRKGMMSRYTLKNMSRLEQTGLLGSPRKMAKTDNKWK